jgi:hypothetical protein
MKDMIYIVGKQCCVCDRILTKEYITKYGCHEGRDIYGKLEKLMCHHCATKFLDNDKKVKNKTC